MVFCMALIMCGFCVCCAGPDKELMEGAFLSASFFFLFILDKICAVACNY